jgi:hypothetical protein
MCIIVTIGGCDDAMMIYYSLISLPLYNEEPTTIETNRTKSPTIPSKNRLDLIALSMLSRALKTTGTSLPQFRHVGDKEEEETVE